MQGKTGDVTPRRGSPPEPPESGRGSPQETLRVEALTAGGDGLARPEGAPVTFVRGAAPGDLVRAAIVEDRGRFRRAEIVDVLEPGEGRRAPPCPEAGACGGCPWMHLTEDAQATAARDIVVSALARAHVPFEPESVRATMTPPRGGLRRRLRLHLRLGSRPRGGFLRARSHVVHPVARCMALEPALEAIRSAVMARLPALTHALGAASAELSIDLPREDAAAALLRVHADADERALGAALRELAAVAPLVALRAESRAARAVHGEERVAFRRGPLEEPERWPALLSPGAFLQPSKDGSELLTSLVLVALREAGLVPGSRVLELFAGSGQFTLPLAGAGYDVEASDADAASVMDATLTARSEDFPLPLRWIAAPAERHVADALGRGARFDAIVIDPPRTGAREVAASLAGLARAVAWVSCDVATFARDAALLAAKGLRLAWVQPVLLFPQTASFETVALFLKDPDP